MLTKANQNKLQAFKEQRKNSKQLEQNYKDYDMDIPQVVSDVLLNLYVGHKIELSEDSVQLEIQQELLKLNLITIKGNKKLALTKQGQELCKHGFLNKKHLIDWKNCWRESLASFVVSGFISIIITSLGKMGSNETLYAYMPTTNNIFINIAILIFFLISITSLIIFIISSIRLDACSDNRIQLSEVLINLKKYCGNHYQSEFKKFQNFVRNI